MCTVVKTGCYRKHCVILDFCMDLRLLHKVVVVSWVIRSCKDSFCTKLRLLMCVCVCVCLSVHLVYVHVSAMLTSTYTFLVSVLLPAVAPWPHDPKKALTQSWDHAKMPWQWYYYNCHARISETKNDWYKFISLFFYNFRECLILNLIHILFWIWYIFFFISENVFTAHTAVYLLSFRPLLTTYLTWIKVVNLYFVCPGCVCFEWSCRTRFSTMEVP